MHESEIHSSVFCLILVKEAYKKNTSRNFKELESESKLLPFVMSYSCSDFLMEIPTEN